MRPTASFCTFTVNGNAKSSGKRGGVSSSGLGGTGLGVICTSPALNSRTKICLSHNWLLSQSNTNSLTATSADSVCTCQPLPEKPCHNVPCSCSARIDTGTCAFCGKVNKAKRKPECVPNSHHAPPATANNSTNTSSSNTRTIRHSILRLGGFFCASTILTTSSNGMGSRWGGRDGADRFIKNASIRSH